MVTQFDLAKLKYLFPGCPNYMLTVHFIQGQAIRHPSEFSLVNLQEAAHVINIVQQLITANVPMSSIGIIALYKTQAELIQFCLDCQTIKTLFCTTPNGIQGGEADYVIITAVRTPGQSVFLCRQHTLNYAVTNHGYVTNNRANVACTRAKLGTILICHPYAYVQHPFFARVINIVANNHALRAYANPLTLQQIQAYLHLLPVQ
jgi:superfamily I DNA and/or RNA helicase